MAYGFGFTSALGFGGGRTSLVPAARQFGSWFVVRVLPHQFSSKGLCQLLASGMSGLQVGFEAIGKGKQGFDMTDAFGLLV